MPTRLEELTERARRTLARSGAPNPAGFTAGSGGAPASSVDRHAPAAGSAAGEVVLGIDPGIGTTGYGVIWVPPETSTSESGLGTFQALTYGVVETPPGEPVPHRLMLIHRQLEKIIRTYQPTQAAVEQLFFGRNVTTAVTVGQARGVALLAIGQADLSLFEYKPAEVKQTVAGYGRADKHQMQRMVQTLLQLESLPRPDDAADALAIALCHLRFARVRAMQASDVPSSATSAMALTP